MTTLIRRALTFAEQAHEGQTRKYTGEPYIAHPTAVVGILAALPHDVVPEWVLAAAAMHDVVEDCGITLTELEAKFGYHVARLVGEVTTPPSTLPRRQRKLMEAHRLHWVSAEAQNIKYADIIDNTKDILEKDPTFAQIYLREKRDVLLQMDHGYAPLRGRAWNQVTELLK